jgi:hypothetical protein
MLLSPTHVSGFSGEKVTYICAWLLGTAINVDIDCTSSSPCLRVPLSLVVRDNGHVSRYLMTRLQSYRFTQQKLELLFHLT